MLTEQEEAVDDFHCGLQEAYQEGVSNDALGKARAKGWDHFLELGLPTRRDEAFRTVPLHRLMAHQYRPVAVSVVSAEELKKHVLPECQHSVLVYVNGRYCADLSDVTAVEEETDGRVVIAPLQTAARTFGAFLNNRWKKTIKEESDPFAALNTAAHGEAVFVYVPPKVTVAKPLQVLNLVDCADQKAVLMPRFQAFVGAGSELQIVSTTGWLSGEQYWINQVTDIAIEENAHVKMLQYVDDAAEGSWHFDAVRTQLKRDSSFDCVTMTDGASTMRNSYVAALTGENGSVSLAGLAALGGRREAHTHILIDHQAPHCDSRQLFKTVLNDRSRSSFEGKILVQQLAQKTDAFQLNNNLILSDKAHADSKPNLEIFADDVKASHGATVGQLDADELFYLKTRGFSDNDAKRLMVNGFSKEVLDLIPLRSIREAAAAKTMKVFK